MQRYFILTFMVLSSIFSLAVFSKALPSLILELGDEISFDSKILNQERKLFVRLPKGYATSKRNYPVVYLLDANDFSVDNLYQQSISLINRLENNKDIPEVILVGIQSQQWYQDAIESSDLFEKFIHVEVTELINKKFRTLDNKIIIGHSYAAVMLTASFAQKKKQFDTYLAISPVFPDLAYIEKIQSRYQTVSQSADLSNRYLSIIQGDEDPFEINLLISTAKNLAKSPKVYHQSIPDENHQSVFSIGLNLGLRQYFAGYRVPSRTNLIQQQYSYKKLKKYYDKRALKYNINEADNTDDFENAVTSFAQDYASLNEIDLALTFWQKSNSRFRFFFMNGIVDNLLKENDFQSAIKVMEKIVELAKKQKADKLSEYQSKLDAMNNNQG